MTSLASTPKFDNSEHASQQGAEMADLRLHVGRGGQKRAKFVRSVYATILNVVFDRLPVVRQIVSARAGDLRSESRRQGRLDQVQAMPVRHSNRRDEAR